jgi:hypothetical protein
MPWGPKFSELQPLPDLRQRPATTVTVIALARPESRRPLVHERSKLAMAAIGPFGSFSGSPVARKYLRANLSEIVLSFVRVARIPTGAELLMLEAALLNGGIGELLVQRLLRRTVDT